MHSSLSLTYYDQILYKHHCVMLHLPFLLFVGMVNILQVMGVATVSLLRSGPFGIDNIQILLHMRRL